MEEETRHALRQFGVDISRDSLGTFPVLDHRDLEDRLIRQSLVGIVRGLAGCGYGEDAVQGCGCLYSKDVEVAAPEYGLGDWSKSQHHSVQ